MKKLLLLLIVLVIGCDKDEVTTPEDSSLPKISAKNESEDNSFDECFGGWLYIDGHKSCSELIDHVYSYIPQYYSHVVSRGEHDIELDIQGYYNQLVLVELRTIDERIEWDTTSVSKNIKLKMPAIEGRYFVKLWKAELTENEGGSIETDSIHDRLWHIKQ